MVPARRLPAPRIVRAARTLAAGGVIAYPTEAVFGLGCDPDDPAAVARLLRIKRRPAHKGLILVAATFESLTGFVEPLDDRRMAPVLGSWPGPYTWILPARGGRAPWLRNRGGRTLAVRVTDHPVVRRLCLAFGGPIVSTSANRSGQPALRDPLAVRLRLGAALDDVVPAAVGGRAGPSEIRDARDGRLIRPQPENPRP